MKFEMKVKLPDFKKLEKEIIEEAERKLRAKIKEANSITCPDHKEHATIKSVRKDNKVSFVIISCCEKLRKMVETKLSK